MLNSLWLQMDLETCVILKFQATERFQKMVMHLVAFNTRWEIASASLSSRKPKKINPNPSSFLYILCPYKE